MLVNTASAGAVLSGGWTCRIRTGLDAGGRVVGVATRIEGAANGEAPG